MSENVRRKRGRAPTPQEEDEARAIASIHEAARWLLVGWVLAHDRIAETRVAELTGVNRKTLRRWKQTRSPGRGGPR
jgi:hypothetical protein